MPFSPFPATNTPLYVPFCHWLIRCCFSICSLHLMTPLPWPSLWLPSIWQDLFSRPQLSDYALSIHFQTSKYPCFSISLPYSLHLTFFQALNKWFIVPTSGSNNLFLDLIYFVSSSSWTQLLFCSFAFLVVYVSLDMYSYWTYLVKYRFCFYQDKFYLTLTTSFRGKTSISFINSLLDFSMIISICKLKSNQT